ncbi:hypothetical protein [Oleiagrimonas sp.]|jgi:hypothetical protein|uniref:hypothetical protein n=1 Tax=Oleiagrimonas sp. TaxID=2010330 RepID=UPI002625BA6C|nr:hypothetical protein [Oleiagrimonas sp.]MDA3915131.1 hypothetical protein [Oleiagrimonas sp.]
MLSNEQRINDSQALHHDLRIEMGRVELAMETLALQSGEDASLRQQRLETRMSKLQEALRRLPA